MKLLAQKRTYLGLLAATVIPIIASSSCSRSSPGSGPSDVPLGRYLRDTGLSAVPFVVLFFMSIWGLPGLLTALVAGDIVASESHNGTLKTILTRSRDRGEVFAGKALATASYTIALCLPDGDRRGRRRQHQRGASTRSPRCPEPRSRQVTGSHSCSEASRSTRFRSRALPRSACFLSTITRNSAASVVGALMWALFMQLLGVLPRHREHPSLSPQHAVRRSGTAFLRVPADWVPVTRALWVSGTLYIALPLFPGYAYLVFLRRDVAGE